MERKMMLLTALPFIILLTKVRADECGNSCTSSQICGNDGICYEKSDLITCSSLTSIYHRHYCLKTLDCCGDGCMPKGSVCCTFASRYCNSDQKCCSFFNCCPADKTSTSPSTSKQSTRTTARPITRYPPRTTARPPRTTAKPFTRYPPRTTKWFENRTQRSHTSETKSGLNSWVYAVIVIVVLAVITVSVVVALLIRRHQNNASNAQSGRRGVVLNAPAPINGPAIGSSGTRPGIPIKTNIPPQQLQVAYVAT